MKIDRIIRLLDRARRYIICFVAFAVAFFLATASAVAAGILGLTDHVFGWIYCMIATGAIAGGFLLLWAKTLGAIELAERDDRLPPGGSS